MYAALPPDARVLFTAPAAVQVVEECSQRVPQGSVTVLAAEIAALPATRRLYAGLANVMASPGGRDDIPWGDQRYRLILDIDPDHPTSEMLRVLEPGGSILALQDLAHGI